MSIKTPIEDKVIEYIEETSFGEPPKDGSMNWIGLVESFASPVETSLEKTVYISAHNATNTLMDYRHTKTGMKLIPIDFTYYPQDWDLLQYFTGSATGFSDTVKSLCFLRKLGAKYYVFKGALGTKYEVSVPENGRVSVSVSLLCGHSSDPVTDDPLEKGGELYTDSSGNHAKEAAGEQFTWDGLSGLKMDASDNPVTDIAAVVGGIKFGFTQTVEMPLDPTSTLSTKAAGGVVMKPRDVSVSLEIIDVDDSIDSLVRSATKQNFKFTLGGKTFTFKGLIFPKYTGEMKPSDLVGEEITAVMDSPALTIA
jgi:hypothetical protein